MGTSERDFNEICIAIIIFHARDQGKRTGGGCVNLLRSKALFKMLTMMPEIKEEAKCEVDKRKVV